MHTDTATAPLRVLPWITVWSEDTILASIAQDKVHVVTRTVTSDNRVSGVTDLTAERETTYRAQCGTTRRGRVLAVEASATVTCARCAK